MGIWRENKSNLDHIEEKAYLIELKIYQLHPFVLEVVLVLVWVQPSEKGKKR